MENLIKKLIEKHGSRKRVAELLQITPRYVLMLEKGLKPGKHLARFIKMLSA